MNRKKDIIKIINSMSGKYSSYEIFSDWIKMSSLSIANSCQLFHDRVWESREKAYLDTVQRYSAQDLKKLIECFGLLYETLETEMTDALGEIYMEGNMGNKATG